MVWYVRGAWCVIEFRLLPRFSFRNNTDAIAAAAATVATLLIHANDEWNFIIFVRQRHDTHNIRHTKEFNAHFVRTRGTKLAQTHFSISGSRLFTETMCEAMKNHNNNKTGSWFWYGYSCVPTYAAERHTSLVAIHFSPVSTTAPTRNDNSKD